eukprot:GSMAST32.ASY1.ANO1.2386.1 assembled CDS
MSCVASVLKKLLPAGIPLSPLPPPVSRDSSVPHAPKRRPNLSKSETSQAIANALRYFPSQFHAELAPEFAEELRNYGHIYMYRFRPTEYEMKAYPLDTYPCESNQAASIILMVMNNLDYRYHLLMYYLCQMDNKQTLVMASGHPQGIYPSHSGAPRCVLTNGMVIPNHSSKQDYEKMFALYFLKYFSQCMGVSMYGQMTAGSYCYIGPQGIVHVWKVYLSSGLGGMSGAQAKAAVVCGAVGILCEVNEDALNKRHEQGWVLEKITDIDELIHRTREAKAKKESISIGFHGNIVDVWEKFSSIADKTGEVLIDLGSDQTSLHNPWAGGYYPVDLSVEESNELMVKNPKLFKECVQKSLRRQVNAINNLASKGVFFWDYGNAFLKEAAAAENNSNINFRYPSYVQDIMGDIFSLGFGPFRWVCTLNHDDLKMTDTIAAQVMTEQKELAPAKVIAQLNDNIMWIENAESNNLVVGSEARILYADCEGRTKIALAFNEAIASGKLKGPVILSRDHHDVSGTDSPYRETSNIEDGSHFCADMAVQNFVGDAIRGCTWVALHNGGGCGWEAAERAKSVLLWDVNNGISRRSWAKNNNAEDAIKREMKRTPRLKVTLPNHVDCTLLDHAVSVARMKIPL